MDENSFKLLFCAKAGSIFALYLNESLWNKNGFLLEAIQLIDAKEMSEGTEFYTFCFQCFVAGRADPVKSATANRAPDPVWLDVKFHTQNINSKALNRYFC